MKRIWLTAVLLAGAGGFAGCDDSARDGGRAPDAGRDEDAGPLPASDAGPPPATAEACFAGLAEPDTGWVEVQRFKTEDGSHRVWRARQRIEAPTVGETSAYELVRFWVDGGGEAGICVRDASALSYTYAHHNWDEKWQATTDSALYLGQERFLNAAEGGWEDTLTVNDRDGNSIAGPLTLLEDGCWSFPYNLNVCVLRTRVDEPPPGWGEE